MSQNCICLDTAHGPVNVIAGYDRPLAQLFCNILCDEGFDEDDEDDTSHPFAHLFMREYASVEEMGSVLAEAGIVLPPAMLQAIATDEAQMAGNVIRRFGRDGTLLPL